MSEAMAEAPPWRVVLVDGQRVVVEALELACVVGGIDCVGIATNGADGLRLVCDLAPDVVVLDPVLPDTDGVELAGQVVANCPQTRVILLSGVSEPVLVRAAANAGASAFVSKYMSVNVVVEAIKRVAADGGHIDPGLSAQVAEQARRSSAPLSANGNGLSRRSEPGRLGAREREVLGLLASGLDTQAIADELGISRHTVRDHTKSVLAKLGAHSQVQAVIAGVRQGLVTIR